MNRTELGFAQDRILLGVAEEQDYEAAASAKRKKEDHPIFHILFFIAFAAMFFL